MDFIEKVSREPSYFIYSNLHFETLFCKTEQITYVLHKLIHAKHCKYLNFNLIKLPSIMLHNKI